MEFLKCLALMTRATTPGSIYWLGSRSLLPWCGSSATCWREVDLRFQTKLVNSLRSPSSAAPRFTLAVISRVCKIACETLQPGTASRAVLRTPSALGPKCCDVAMYASKNRRRIFFTAYVSPKVDRVRKIALTRCAGFDRRAKAILHTLRRQPQKHSASRAALHAVPPRAVISRVCKIACEALQPGTASRAILRTPSALGPKCCDVAM